MIFQLAITVSCSRLNQQQTLLCQTPFIMPSFCCWEGLPNNAFTHICHGSHCGTWKSLRDWHQPRSAFTIGGKEWATFLLWTWAPISSLEIRMGYSPARLCWEQSLLGTFTSFYWFCVPACLSCMQHSVSSVAVCGLPQSKRLILYSVIPSQRNLI